jgi:catechol 2,3-dioxygenase-like lactoylglutathione lyase family enzyme
MEQKVTFLTLGVADIETSIDFYENKFGWKRSEMSNDDLIMYQLNGLFLALYPREELAKDATINQDGSGFKGFSISYNTKSELEVEEIVKELKDRGVQIIKEPQKVFWGGYSSYIADPDGNLWEIAYNPFLKND